MGKLGVKVIAPYVAQFPDSDLILEDPDRKIFTRDGDIWKTTDYFRYICSQNALVQYKKAVLAMDVDHLYSYDKVAEVADPEELKALKTKFKAEKAAYERDVKKWKEENQDLFVQVPSLPSVACYFGNFKLDVHKPATLADAALGYRIAQAVSAEYGKDQLDEWKTDTKTMVDPQYKKQFEAYQKQRREYYGLPTDADMKKECKDRVQTVTPTLSKMLSTMPWDQSQGDQPAVGYTDELVEFLILG